MADTTMEELKTTEEIQAYAEEVVKEVEADRAGEQKSDAQITSEHANNTPSKATPSDDDTPAETNSGSDDTAEVEDQGDDTGNEEASWLDDELKAEATAYGIDESELSDFASREELERVFKLFDKSALDAGRKELAKEGSTETEEGQARNEKGQFEKKEDPKDEPKGSKYEVQLDTELYDEGIVEEFARMRDHYESRLEFLESKFAESEAIAKERHFDSLVDQLGHEDLFGKTDKETGEEKKRRTDLLVEAETYLRGREALGRPTELTQALLNRIARSLFAEELGKKELKQRTRKISRQSKGRQGGGATRPQDPREDPRDEFDRLYRELERA